MIVHQQHQCNGQGFPTLESFSQLKSASFQVYLSVFQHLLHVTRREETKLMQYQREIDEATIIHHIRVTWLTISPIPQRN